MTRSVGRTATGGEPPLRLIATFPDVRRPRRPPMAAGSDMLDRPTRSEDTDRPRIGWGSIAILAVVAAASCGAAWWQDRGHHDPAAVEIQRIRVAERMERRAARRSGMHEHLPVKR